MSPPFAIRYERPDDEAAVRSVVGQAFGQQAEADLIDALRADGDLVLSLLAIGNGPVGHIAFSRLTLPESTARACALAPLAVLPANQRRGIGAVLVQEGLRRLAQSGEDLVLVLGDPAYYGRFGFTAEAARNLRTPYDGPYLQGLALTDAGRAARSSVRYARAFSRLA